MEFMICRNCETPDPYWEIDVARGDHICSHCGMVGEDRVIDTSLERRNFSDSGKDHNRAEKVDPYFEAKSLGKTRIRSDPKKRGKIKKTKLSESNKQLENTGVSLIEKHLEEYFSEIQTYVTLLELKKNVLDTAKALLYKYESLEVGKRRTLPIKPGALAAIHLACGNLKVGRPLFDLIFSLNCAGCDDVSEQEVWNARKKILSRLPGSESPTQPEDVINTFSDNLSLSMSVKRAACMICQRVAPHMEGKRPSTIAAGTIMLACQLLEVEIAMDDLVVVSNVSATTLTGFCRQAKKEFDVLISPAEMEKLKNSTEKLKEKLKIQQKEKLKNSTEK